MFSNTSYHRLQDGDKQDIQPRASFYINFRYFTLATCSLPLFAFWFCIGYSIIYNFERSIATSCGAANFLPSISAAIGGFSPQREVWQLAISFDFLPRLVLIYVYLNNNYSNTGNKLVYIRSVLMFIENAALLSLTYYDSTHDYTIHRNSFTTFILTSLMHMFLLLWSSRHSERFELKLKNRLAIVNLFSVIFAMIFFILHGIFCPDYVYSLFALSEYIVVLTNIAYHGSIIYEFPDLYLIISPGDCIKLDYPRRNVMTHPKVKKRKYFDNKLSVHTSTRRR